LQEPLGQELFDLSDADAALLALMDLDRAWGDDASAAPPCGVPSNAAPSVLRLKFVEDV
jgi:hypothetical protein